MRNSVLFTKEPIDIQKCFLQIKTIYKGAKLNESCISIGKPPKSLYIWFPSSDYNDPIEQIDLEKNNNIMFKNPCITHVDFHLLLSLKNVIKAISIYYPEMIIWTDDDNYYTISELSNLQ